MKPSNLAHRAGRIWGQYALRHILQYYDRRCSTFALSVSGAEHLRAACARPYLLVANHILLRSEETMVYRFLQDTVLRPLAYSHRLLLFNCPSDSFILRRIILEETGRCLRVVARSNGGVWSRRQAGRLLQEQVSHPFGSGLREGLGYIPLDHTGHSQREFLQSVEGAVGRGEPILIFPGRLVHAAAGDHDSLLDGGIHPGAAHLARRHGLPLLPAYITDAEGWRPGQAASVTFGPAFGCDGMSKEEVCREIVERIQACERWSRANHERRPVAVPQRASQDAETGHPHAAPTASR